MSGSRHDDHIFSGRTRRAADFAPGELFEWLKGSKSDNAIEYGGAPTVYSLIDHLNSRYQGSVRTLDGVLLDERVPAEELRVLMATKVEAELQRQAHTRNIRVIFTNNRGFDVHGLQEGSERVITVTQPTMQALIRPLKYWLTLMAPSQMAYLESAGIILPKRRPLTRSVCEAAEQFFDSFGSRGLPASPAIRLGPTGTALLGEVVDAALKFLVLHESYHLSDPEDWPAHFNEEAAADFYALTQLEQHDMTTYLDLMRDFSNGDVGTLGEAADRLPESLFRRSALPSITEHAPLEAGIFAYARIIHELCRTGGNPVSAACLDQIRGVIAQRYSDSRVVNGVWQDLNNPMTLPGFYFTRAWKAFLNTPNLDFLSALRGTVRETRQLLRLRRDVNRR